MSLGDWLSLIGLAIAIEEIWRTGRAVERTRRAVEGAALKASIYSLLLVTPELTRIEHDLEESCIRDDNVSVRRLLAEWRNMASEYRGLLLDKDLGDAGLADAILKSISLSTIAKTQLTDDETSALDATKKVRKEIGVVCQRVRTLSAQIKSSSVALGDNKPNRSIGKFLARTKNRESQEPGG